jgi:hypothetical protein
MTVRYLDRDEWGGGPVRAGVLLPRDRFVGLVAHHTVMVMRDYDHDSRALGDLDDIKHYMRVLQTSRPDLGPEVPYSFVVFRGAEPHDCVVAEGRGFGVTGAHTTGYNSSRYGVAYAGNTSVDEVTPGVLDGYRWVGARLTVASPVPTLGHRDTKSTECPGNNLYALLGRIQPPFEEDDVTEAEFKEWFKEAAAPDHKLLADINHQVFRVLAPGLADIKDKLQQLVDDDEA